MKTFLIGLDGATFDVIKPLVNKGRLPNFKKILDDGFYSVLESTYPPSTFPGWPTIATGLNPAKHGVYGFFDPAKRFPLLNKKISISDADYINRRMNGVNTLWSLLSDRYRVCMINFPGTYPAKKVNGVMVSGLLTPSTTKKGLTYPGNLLSEINEAVKHYEIDAKFQVNKKNALENVNRVAKKRFALLSHFLEKDFDFYCIVFTGLDRIQHYLWGKKDVEMHYELLDEFLGILINKEKDSNFFIVSDHGFQENKNYFYVNKWLIDKGFLNIKSKRKYSVSHMLRQSGINKKNILKLMKLTHTTNLLKLLPMKFKGFVPENRTSIEEADIDWPETKAYSIYSMENGIYLNRDGREPNGVVKNKDYDRIRDQIINELKKEPVKINCLKKEDIYGGPFLEQIPDIILDIKEKGMKFNSSLADEVYGRVDPDKTEDPSGFHQQEGIFMAFGKDIAKGKLNRLKQYDVLPTLLYMLGMPIPKNIDGSVVLDLFDKNSKICNQKLVYIDSVDPILKESIHNISI